MINHTLLGNVRDSCWFDLSFAQAGLILQRIGSYWGQNFILAPLSKRCNSKWGEPEMRRLAVYLQQCSGTYMIIIWNSLVSVFSRGSNAPVLSVPDFPFFPCSNLSAQPVPLCEWAVHPPEAAVRLLSRLHRRLWWAHVWWDGFSWHAAAVFGHVLHPWTEPWALQSNVLSGKNSAEGPSELSLGKRDLTVLSTLELAELLLNPEWLLKMCSPIHCNNRAKLEANYVEELTCNEQVSSRDHKLVSYSAGVKRIYGDMLIFLGKI